MRLFNIIVAILAISFTTIVYAHGSHKKPLYDTGEMATRAVLPPGVKLVAGNTRKNEFFILAPQEKAHAIPSTTSKTPTPSSTVMVSHMTASLVKKAVNHNSLKNKFAYKKLHKVKVAHHTSTNKKQA